MSAIVQGRKGPPNSDAGRRFDVLAVSDMCVDLVMRGNVRPRFQQLEQIIEDYFLEMGGSANIFISQMVKLCARGGLIGWVGKDSFGEFVVGRLREIGVDTTYVRCHPTIKTGVGVALAEENDRAILTYPGSICAVQPDELSSGLLSDTHHWHLASLFLLKPLRSFWKSWLVSCRQCGVTVSLDTNWDPEDRWEGVLELLPLVDVFLPNEAEATKITGESDCFRAAEALARACPLVVVKRDAKGAIAVKGGQVWEMRPHEPELRIADTIGAGDNFDAGFVWGRLLGWDVEACLKLAHRCAVASLGELGGIQGQLREDPARNAEAAVSIRTEGGTGAARGST
jgi:sugar/nucleoside kinase (ribokinase family)